MIESYGIFDAITRDSLGEVRRILVKEGTMNICDAVGTTALHHAVLMENERIVEFFIRNGAEVNSGTSDQGRSPLYSAYVLRNFHIIKILERAGAKKIADKYYWYPDTNL